MSVKAPFQGSVKSSTADLPFGRHKSVKTYIIRKNGLEITVMAVYPIVIRIKEREVNSDD